MKELILKVYRIIFAHKIFVAFNSGLLRLGMCGLGVLNYENNRVSGEKYLIDIILHAHIDSDAPIFFDVGANIGNFSAELLSSFPHAQIYSFEPHPKNFAELKKRSFSRVKAHNFALGSVQGKLTLYDRADFNGSSHASLYKEVISEIHNQEFVSNETDVDTIDRICEREQIKYIDFLKIDTEGNELAVLQGASNMLKERSIGCIHFEFNEMNVVSRVFIRDFKKILSDFDLYRLLPNSKILLEGPAWNTEIFAYQNIVALQKQRQ